MKESATRFGFEGAGGSTSFRVEPVTIDESHSKNHNGRKVPGTEEGNGHSSGREPIYAEVTVPSVREKLAKDGTYLVADQVRAGTIYNTFASVGGERFSKGKEDDPVTIHWIQLGDGSKISVRERGGGATLWQANANKDNGYTGVLLDFATTTQGVTTTGNNGEEIAVPHIDITVPQDTTAQVIRVTRAGVESQITINLPQSAEEHAALNGSRVIAERARLVQLLPGFKDRVRPGVANGEKITQPVLRAFTLQR